MEELNITYKPVDIMEKLIKRYSKENDTQQHYFEHALSHFRQFSNQTKSINHFEEEFNKFENYYFLRFDPKIRKYLTIMMDTSFPKNTRFMKLLFLTE